MTAPPQTIAEPQVQVRHWDTVPAEVLPLRETLPPIKASTRLLLHSWAWAQPAVRGWLLQRQHEYWVAATSVSGPPSPLPSPPGEGAGAVGQPSGVDAAEALHSHIDAVVALDLLRWQCNCLDREAIEKLSGCAEVASEMRNGECGTRNGPPSASENSAFRVPHSAFKQ